MPKNVDPQKLSPNWSLFPTRTPFNLITSTELARVLGLHGQTLANWRARSVLPSNEPHPPGGGHRVFYSIGKIRAWIENKSLEEIELEWTKQNFPEFKTPNVGKAYYFLTLCYDVFGFDKPQLKPTIASEAQAQGR